MSLYFMSSFSFSSNSYCVRMGVRLFFPGHRLLFQGPYQRLFSISSW